jgi:hypothetical protein
MDWAREQDLERVHVDFETANRPAKRFWLQHFRPCLASVRRKVNADARV